VATAGNPPVVQAQILDIDRTGVPAPAGLAFAAPSETFYVVEASVRGSTSETDVVKLKPSKTTSDSARAGSSRIAAAVQDPINIAFDARRSRLLFLGQASELLELPVGADGELAAAALSRHDAARFGLTSPRGVTVDPTSGVVFVVDADVPRIVRIEPQTDGGFNEATTSQIDLRPSGVADVRGLAFDPSTGHLQLRGGDSLYELTTAGEVVAVRDLAGFDLVNPEGMVIAPSGDQTDETSTTSVYVADSGGGATRASGQIVELSLAPLATPAAIDFTSQLIRTVDMGALSPPSPDPSGITHVPGSGLVVTDAEVEETVNGITHFQGANVWELTLSGAVQRTANISRVPPTVTPMTNEPAGIAFNPSNGHYFVVSDGPDRVFDLNPGADSLVGTADDSWTSFDTNALNSDPEGIAYSTFSGNLFVADGMNREVFQYNTGGALLGNFDVLQYGVNDPNSVEFNPDSGTLLVLSDRHSGTGNQRLIVETTTSGALIRTIDVGASNSFRPDGVAYAPASDGTAVKRFYIVDRVLDNNLDPNAVDGKLYEMTAPAPGNSPPQITSDGGGNTASRSVAENQTAVTTVTAVDPNVGDTLTYSISGGADAARFQINSGTGVLTFVTAPDFENPTDVGANNVYDVTVMVSDGVGGTDSQAIAVTVTDVNEGGGAAPPPADFDGDGDTDISLFRPSTARWYVHNQASVAFGLNGDVPVPGDYDGNGSTDIAVFRPSTARWYVRNGATVAFGLNGDLPQPGDYDGNGTTDIAVFRPSSARWYIRNQTTVAFGLSSDIPLPLPWAIYDRFF
jgi:uncharacterized protein YjiK